MFETLVRLVLALFLAVCLPLFYLIPSPIYLYRYIVAKLVQYYWCSSYGKILTASSTNLGVDEITTKPMWSLVIRLTLTGKTGSGFEEIKRAFGKSVVFFKNENGNFRKPELQQYVSSKFGFLFWKWDKEFRIENHITRKIADFENGVMGKDLVDKITQELIYKPFTPKRSPWELLILENVQDGGVKQDGKRQYILFWRAHHALADGFSILKTLILEFGDSKTVETVATKHNSITTSGSPINTLGNRVTQLLAPVYIIIRMPYDLAYALLEIFQYNSNPWHLPESQLKRTLNGAHTDAISIQTVKELKNLCNCSFVTVVLAAYTAGLRKFMIEAGYKNVPSNILCGVALPIPGHPDHKLRNHASAVLARLPTGISDPLERLRQIENNQARLKKGTLHIFVYYYGILTGGLFTWMVNHMSVNRNTTVIGSIFPATNQPISTRDGKFKCTDASYVGGLTRGNVGLAFSCLSYNSKLTIAVGVDEGLVPESKFPASKLLDYMIEELNILKQAVYIEQETKQLAVVHIA